MGDLEVIDSCDGCGACCLAQTSPPMYVAILWNREAMEGHPEFERVDALPESLKGELQEYIERLKDSSIPNPETPCMWLDAETRRCRHYEHRPNICRDSLERNDENCRAWRELYSDMIE